MKINFPLIIWLFIKIFSTCPPCLEYLQKSPFHIFIPIFSCQKFYEVNKENALFTYEDSYMQVLH
jgi:hypothetical protein